MADSVQTVTIGCKLPHGMILEVGYQVVAADKNGREYASVKRLPNYKRIRLNGWSDMDGSREAARAGIMLPPARLQPTAGITKDVPRDFWQEWKKNHAEMFRKLEEKGVLFEAKDDAEARAKAIDSNAPSVKCGLEPLDPKKLPVAGVVKANFDE